MSVCLYVPVPYPKLMYSKIVYQVFFSDTSLFHKCFCSGMIKHPIETQFLFAPPFFFLTFFFQPLVSGKEKMMVK